ncbi:hypothetical protein ALC60_01198, partial [Trachymyrmex zeteki]
ATYDTLRLPFETGIRSFIFGSYDDEERETVDRPVGRMNKRRRERHKYGGAHRVGSRRSARGEREGEREREEQQARDVEGDGDGQLQVSYSASRPSKAPRSVTSSTFSKRSSGSSTNKGHFTPAFKALINAEKGRRIYIGIWLISVQETLFTPINVIVKASKSGKMTSNHFKMLEETYFPNIGFNSVLLIDSWTGYCPNIIIIKLQSLIRNQLSFPRYHNLFKVTIVKCSWTEEVGTRSTNKVGIANRVCLIRKNNLQRETTASRTIREDEEEHVWTYLRIRQRWHYPETGMTPLASRCDETTTLLLLLLLELAPGVRCYSRAAATSASSLPR